MSSDACGVNLGDSLVFATFLEIVIVIRTVYDSMRVPNMNEKKQVVCLYNLLVVLV